jgi:hypothetical protein
MEHMDELAQKFYFVLMTKYPGLNITLLPLISVFNFVFGQDVRQRSHNFGVLGCTPQK